MLTRRTRASWLWATVGCMATLVRCYRLDHFSYWLDEIIDVYTLRGPWPVMWRSLREGVYNPPLHYSLLKVVEGFDPSDWSRRLVPALWGTACVLVFGWLVARRSTPAVGVTASVLLAFAPYHVRYSQEVRPYSLGMLLVCLSLLLLDMYLERPERKRLAALLLSCLAAAYAMYLAALMVIIAGGALLVGDSFSPDAARRQRARRFLMRSPLYAGVLALGYSPWLAVVLRAVRSPAPSAAPDFRWARAGRLISYFGFAQSDWHPVGASGFLFSLLVAAGVVIAVRRYRLSFVVVWALGGLATVELLEHRHPAYDSVFHYIPAGMALTALAATTIGWLLDSPGPRLGGIALLVLTLMLDGRTLETYFQRGRPDWRPLAGFLRQRPPFETIFTSSQYAQLCVAYYVVGPDWLCCRTAEQRDVISVDNRVSRLLEVWKGERPAWLVLPGHHEAQELRDWSAHYDTLVFPTAEGDGGAIVKQLVPERSP
jgi:Dolichyl-phosphate-mannose-protein mannosyltransferase